MGQFKCEVTGVEVEDEADIAMAQEISKQLCIEENLQKAYNRFRMKKDLEPVDFSAPENRVYLVKLCLEMLLECFQARRVESGNYELDEVSAYRGSILQGIGLTKHGRYNRKQGDEMGIPRKR